ncbi:uncharacterized protein A4U43_C01F20940 [Asparagus officinalis]|uniref:Pentacotripeptide-repeat region of PRORP domain-containing protein n=2 Tax=Asparagus officinalis TaxID=4686 RepID=A0A5P1FQY0_ASPOF|nr:uncharacterized protein A4U43_C01F20940 [Asparagus officinalis]
MGRLGLTEEARKVHAFVLKSGFEFDSYVRSSLIGVFADLGCVEVARLLFDEMPKRSLVCWNALISGLVRGREFEGAISVFEKMAEEGLEPDEATLVSTLSACVQLRNLELWKKFRRYINESFKFSLPIGNVLLDLYAKCGCLDLARTSFDGMPMRNVISWTNMISGYLNLGRLHEARELFDSSPTKDIILWTTMLNGYVQYNQYEEALSLFQKMSMKRIKLDKFTVVTLLTACANLGALEQGEWIHEYIKNNMIQTDAVISTALIEMYSKCGCIEKAMEVFRNVQGRKDAKSWTSIVCALARNGQAARALEMFSDMQMYGAKPDDITFIGVLAACSHGGLLNEGRRYFYEMKEIHRIEPRIDHYGCFIDLLGRFGLLEEAKELIERTSNVKDCDVLSLWGSLLGACRIHGNAEMGKRIVKKVVDYESRDSGLHVSIANLYAAAGRWEDVYRVRGKMKDTGVKKTPGCSSIASYSDIPVLNSMNRVMEMKEMEEVDKGLMGAVS